MMRKRISTEVEEEVVVVERRGGKELWRCKQRLKQRLKQRSRLNDNG